MSRMDLDDRPYRAAKNCCVYALAAKRSEADTWFADTRFGMMANSRDRFIVGRTNEPYALEEDMLSGKRLSL